LAPSHTKVFAAPVALGPATTLIAVKSEVGNAKVHWSPAGWVPVEVSERSSLIVVPAAALPEPSASETSFAANAESERPTKTSALVSIVKLK